MYRSEDLCVPSSQYSCEFGSILSLYMENLKLRKVKKLAQDPTAGMEKS